MIDIFERQPDIDACNGVSKEAIEIIEKSELLIFDFDGTIADTEPYQCKSYFEALRSQKIEITFDKDFFFDECRGLTIKEIWDKMFKLLNLEEYDTEFYENTRRNALRQLIDEAELKPFEFVYWVLYELAPNTKAVVVTSDEMNFVEPLLAQWKLKERFSSVDARCLENPLSKNERLKLYSEQGGLPVVLEDSQRWLDVSKDYGMKTIGVCSSTPILKADGLIFV